MKEYPTRMTPELREVLGLMNFQTCPVAHALRLAGENIPRKTEAEQAHVLHWMIGLALEHGPSWRDKVSERLKEIAVTQSTCALSARRGLTRRTQHWAGAVARRSPEIQQRKDHHAT